MSLPPNIVCRYWIHSPTDLFRWYISSWNFFFWRTISVCKTISNCFFFFIDRVSGIIKYYRRKESRRIVSVGVFVDNFITDELWITHRRNMSVGKTMKSDNATPCPLESRSSWINVLVPHQLEVVACTSMFLICVPAPNPCTNHLDECNLRLRVINEFWEELRMDELA